MHSDRALSPPIALMLAGLGLCLPSSANADWIASGFLGHAWTRSSTVVLAIQDRKTALEIDGVE